MNTYFRGDLVVCEGHLLVMDKNLTNEVIRKHIESYHLTDVEVVADENRKNLVWFRAVGSYVEWMAHNIAEHLKKLMMTCAQTVRVASLASIPELLPAPEPMTKRRLKSATA